MEFTVIPYKSPAYTSMCELRDEVLRKPIGLRLSPAETEKDRGDILLVGLENGRVVACCILTEMDRTSVKLRQMAVSPACQGKGIGKSLLLFAEKTAREKQYDTICLHARKIAYGFYEKQNYSVVGKEFTEVGIPHFEMTKTINLSRIMDLKSLVRENIFHLKPYSCARDEFKGEASVYLDANESPYNLDFHRYPDPLQGALKAKISEIKNIRPARIAIGNGSDETIDLAFRIFCEPGKDNVVAIEPTYGMYKVCADINNVEYRKVLLDENFQLDAEKLLAATDAHTQLIFLCSPNNPSGNLLKRAEMLKVVENFPGIVIIDEAYVDFSGEPSWLDDLDKYPHLIVCQTFSKAWGLAGLRCGLAFASEEIIALFNKVKYPYNISALVQQTVLEQLKVGSGSKNEWVRLILEEKEPLIKELKSLPFVEKIWPSDANFLLVSVKDANKIYQALVDRGIIVRNRNSVSLCDNCLRITIGTKDENRMLIDALSLIYV
jgi:histidinol-phosphate aminotransferase